MRNAARVLAFDVAAPLAAIAGLLAIGLMLGWPLWWVSVCSMLCLLVVQAMVVDVALYRRDSVTVGTDDDAPGLRLAAVGVAVVGIGSNDVDSYPDDAPDRIAEAAGEWGWEFPCVFDADQSVAHAYRAACTPDFFVFDRNRRLVYRGQMDGARPSNDVAVTGEDLRAAALAAAAGSPPPEQQLPSLGCNIKWKSGNEPDWFR